MKQNKLILAVSPNPDTRAAIMRRLLVAHGFAVTQHDASKLIQPDVYNINLESAYFVAADNFKLHESPITLQRLYEMAARGIFVLLGVRTLARQYELISEAHYQ